MRLSFHHLKEISFYAFLTVGGLCVDLAVASLFVYAFSFPFFIAGLLGLLAGTLTNYFIHLKITFKSKNLKLSWDSLLRYAQTCLIGMGVRVGSLALLGLLTNFSAFLSFVLATGLSFAINFILTKFYVFRIFD